MAKWTQKHRDSGATVLEARVSGCKLVVIPENWSRPKGAAVWSATCNRSGGKGFGHARGNASTVKNAKKKAVHAIKKITTGS